MFGSQEVQKRFMCIFSLEFMKGHRIEYLVIKGIECSNFYICAYIIESKYNYLLLLVYCSHSSNSPFMNLTNRQGTNTMF